MEQCRQRKREQEQILKELEKRREQLQFVAEPLPSVRDFDEEYRLKALKDLRSHQRALTNCCEEIRRMGASQTMLQKRIHLAEMAGRLKGEFAACEKEYLRQIQDIDHAKFIVNFERARKGKWTLEENTEREMINAMRTYKINAHSNRN